MIIDRSQDRTRAEFTKPFFMYLAFHSVHAPDECSEYWYKQFGSFPDTDNRRTMAGQVSAMDSSVGKILEHWQRSKSTEFWNNSFFFFHSDNGGPVYPGAGTNNYRA
jgi:arylsulfatase A-like enzyme|eukprot:COSAG06_NODE_7822_length_2368_cov_10.134717_4_plen_107_part_00